MQQRDYSQDLEAILLSKPQRLTAESFTMVQDYIMKPLAKTASNISAETDTNIEDAEGTNV